jgi:chemotaxis protein CheC
MEMNLLNNIETDVAKEVINIGLGKAADSLSFFSQQKVIIRNSELYFKRADTVDKLSNKKGDNIYILTTEVIGDMTGVCYLIFNEQEADELIKLSIPPSMLQDEEQKKMMASEILKEADNIISASVITQFSNLLNINMHGGVPAIDEVKDSALTEFMLSQKVPSSPLLQINAQFHTETIDFSPEFIWFLDNKFIEGIKKFVEDDPSLEKLKNIK